MMKHFAMFCLIGFTFASALTGAMGEFFQAAAYFLTVFVPTFVLGLVILGDGAKARQHARQSTTEPFSHDHSKSACGFTDDVDRLRANLELVQRKAALLERYAQRLCSVEDVAHAKALRLRAEIDLIRCEKRPKSWAETCAQQCSHHTK